MEKMASLAKDLSPCTMLVVAAGQGRRFGGELPKQYRAVAGRPLLLHALAHLHAHPLVERIVPVIAPDGFDLWERYLQPHLDRLPKVTTPVAGGSERQHSVRLGLASLALAADAWVGIHDGARPLVQHDLLDRLLRARTQADALIVALPAHDTVKRVATDHHVVATLNRQEIWLAQTPQIFRYALVRNAHAQAAADGFIGTDDASLVERFGAAVHVVLGDPRNMKVTHPYDETFVTLLLQEEAP
ncbi:MAG: 2-C-methyl-D-erythritol 4-phosphate cytidylyltransferase [Magnetococcales bacterium]|nr:2-C-methyl-D-erythritol 4-phosphate cytidylyltransferase [Magnetococcales bacterium]